MKKLMFISILLFSPVLYAAEECVTIDVSGYNQEQKNFLEAASYRLMFEAGDDRVPSLVNNNAGTVCFVDPAVNISTVLSQTNVTNKINEMILDAENTPEEITTSQREDAKVKLDSVEPDGKLLRALADIIRDEINILRQWDAAFKVEVAAASNLADLKTRVATLPATPDRTLAQLKTAIQNRIDSGQVDS